MRAARPKGPEGGARPSARSAAGLDRPRACGTEWNALEWNEKELSKRIEWRWKSNERTEWKSTEIHGMNVDSYSPMSEAVF